MGAIILRGIRLERLPNNFRRPLEPLITLIEVDCVQVTRLLLFTETLTAGPHDILHRNYAAVIAHQIRLLMHLDLAHRK